MAEEKKEVKTEAKAPAKKVVPKEAVQAEPKEKAPKTPKTEIVKTEVKEEKAAKVPKAETVKAETKEAKVPKAEAKAEVKKEAPKAKKATDGKKVRLTLLRSTNNVSEKQKRTIQALGLKKIRSVVEKPDNACTRGMIFIVKHMIKVENID